jgi:hypothetical protein
VTTAEANAGLCFGWNDGQLEIRRGELVDPLHSARPQQIGAGQAEAG